MLLASFWVEIKACYCQLRWSRAHPYMRGQGLFLSVDGDSSSPSTWSLKVTPVVPWEWTCLD